MDPEFTMQIEGDDTFQGSDAQGDAQQGAPEDVTSIFSLVSEVDYDDEKLFLRVRDRVRKYKGMQAKKENIEVETAKLAKTYRRRKNKLLDVLSSQIVAIKPPRMLVKSSLNVFSLKNPIRKHLINIVLNKWFDYFVTMIIIINVFFLCLDDPLAPDDDPLQQVISGINYFIVVIFMFEMFGKIIALGLFIGPGTYLRDGWNVLDCVVNIISFIGLFPGIGRFNAFRTLRVLRILSINKKLEGLQIIVNALLKSLAGIANVALLILFVFVITSIFSTQMWMGLLYQGCTTVTTGQWVNDTWIPLPDNSTLLNETWYSPYFPDDPLYSFYGIDNGIPDINLTQYYILDDNDNSRICTVNSGMHFCPVGDVCSRNNASDPGFLKFDNFGWSFLALFIVMSMDGWSFVMYNLQDGSSQWVWIFFVCFVVLTTMFCVQLMLAVIAIKFDDVMKDKQEEKKKRRLFKRELLKAQDLEEKEEEEEEEGSSSSEEIAIEEEVETELAPWQIWIRDNIVTRKAFDIFLICAIVANLITLSMPFYGIPAMPDAYASALEIFNYVFTGIFIVEMILKLCALGWRGYFADNLNKFDFVIVLSSILEIILDVVISVKSGLIVLRTFRLFRVFKLVKSWKGLREILRTVSRSLGSVVYLTILLIIFILIFALAGRQLFAGKITERTNYDTLWDACLTSFQVLTGDNWSNILNAVMSVSLFGAIYVCLNFALGQYVFISLFVGVLLSKFEDAAPRLKLAQDEDGNKLLVEYSGSSSTEFSDIVDNEADDVVELDEMKKNAKKDIKVKKKMTTNQGKVKYYFDGRIKFKKGESTSKLEGKSLNIFGADNPIRLACWHIITFMVPKCWGKRDMMNVFDMVITFVITCNLITLTIEHSVDVTGYEYIFNAIEYVFASIYVLEMIFKVISMGFIFEKNAYLKNNWNIFDFIVVVISIFSLIFPRVQFLKSLRSIRILQVLSRFDETRVVVKAIGQAMSAVSTVFIVLILFWFIFGVVGVNLFGGQFWSCNDSNVTTVDECVGFYDDGTDSNATREWTNPPQNFDNIGYALITLFQIATLSGAFDIMNAAQDINGIGYQPVPNNNPANGLYFVAFIIIGSFFTLNLFTSMVIHHFKMIRNQESGSAWLTSKQKKWIQVQAVLQMASPSSALKPPYTGKLAPLNSLLPIVLHPIFENFILLCILLNTVILAVPFYGMAQEEDDILNYLNIALLVIFSLEAVFKIVAFGPKQYFGPQKKYFSMTWNKFDFIIVVGSIIGTSSGSNAIVINVARLFRMARIIRLIKRLSGLNRIFKTFIHSVPYIANIMTIVLTVYFIFGIIGVSLMKGISFEYWSGSAVNWWANFDNLPNALLTLFRVSTFDEWPTLAWSAAGYWCTPGPDVVCGSSWYLVYFVCFIIIQTNIIMNLFLAILIENFTTMQQRDEKVSKLIAFDAFKNIWNSVDKEATGYIPVDSLVRLLLSIGLPLGFQGNIYQSEIIEEFDKMQLYIYNDNQINFYDLLRGLTIRTLNIDLKKLDILEIEEFTKGRTEKTVADYYRTESHKVQHVYTDEEKKKHKNDDFFFQRNNPQALAATVDSPRSVDDEIISDIEDLDIQFETSATESNLETESESVSKNPKHHIAAKTDLLSFKKEALKERKILRKKIESKLSNISLQLQEEDKARKKANFLKKVWE